MNNTGLPLDLGSSDQLGPDAPALMRAAFERWYSDSGKWSQSVERNSSGEGYKYGGPQAPGRRGRPPPQRT